MTINTQPDFICVNERLTDSLSCLDRGLAFGDGVFETMRVQNGDIPLWKYHQDRLLDGLSRLNISIPRSRLSQAFELQSEAILSNRNNFPSGVSKLIVTRGSSAGGYQYEDDIEPNIILTYASRAYPSSCREHLFRCATPVYENPAVAGLKHLNRLENVLARQEVSLAGYEDGFLCDSNGCVVETTNSNLFFIKDSTTIVTPRLSKAGVRGVMSQFLREQVLPSLNIDVVEGEVHWRSLESYRGVFKTNAVIGVTEVASMGCACFDSQPLIALIRDALHEQLSYQMKNPQEIVFE